VWKVVRYLATLRSRSILLLLTLCLHLSVLELCTYALPSIHTQFIRCSFHFSPSLIPSALRFSGATRRRTFAYPATRYAHSLLRVVLPGPALVVTAAPVPCGNWNFSATTLRCAGSISSVRQAAPCTYDTGFCGYSSISDLIYGPSCAHSCYCAHISTFDRYV